MEIEVGEKENQEKKENVEANNNNNAIEDLKTNLVEGEENKVAAAVAN